MTKVLIFFLLISNICLSQTIKIGIETDFSTEPFNSLVFIVNGTVINSNDTYLKTVKINKKGFDDFSYYYKNKKEVVHKVKCKFIENNTYMISPCVCCGDFMVTADSSSTREMRRGMVRFVNKTDRKLIGIRSNFDEDKIAAKSVSKYLPSYISMNCGFRPFDIGIAEFEYSDPKFEYNEESTDEEIKALRDELNTLWLSSEPFLFLHGEKITATYNDKKRKIELTFDGYMTDSEYQNDYLNYYAD